MEEEPTEAERREGVRRLREEARKAGMTVEEYIDGPIREILESIWELQGKKVGGGPVSIDALQDKLEEKSGNNGG